MIPATSISAIAGQPVRHATHCAPIPTMPTSATTRARLLITAHVRASATFTQELRDDHETTFCRAGRTFHRLPDGPARRFRSTRGAGGAFASSARMEE